MSYKEDALPLLLENEAPQRHQQGFGEDEGDQRLHGILPPPMSSFDIESSTTSNVRERQQQQQNRRVVVRPSRGLQIAKPTPFEPITDPFAFVCDMVGRPTFGHQYVLCPDRSRKRGDRGVGLSVGPHWAGVIYTMSIIGVITLFLARVLVGPDVAPWCQPVIVGCSFVTVMFLLATAVADPGIGERPPVVVAELTFCERSGLLWTYSFELSSRYVTHHAIATGLSYACMQTEPTCPQLLCPASVCLMMKTLSMRARFFQWSNLLSRGKAEVVATAKSARYGPLRERSTAKNGERETMSVLATSADFLSKSWRRPSKCRIDVFQGVRRGRHNMWHKSGVLCSVATAHQVCINKSCTLFLVCGK